MHTYRLHLMLIFFLLSSSGASLLAQKVAVVQTSSDLKTALHPERTLSFGLSPVDGVRIDVDSNQRFQTIDGFGAAMTDSSAWLLEEQLSAGQRREVMRKLFDPAGGIGISFLRVPLGASDLSRNFYTYDDIPAGIGDPDLSRFSIKHDEEYILPALRQALKLNPSISVMVTPWSPPGWMKTNNSTVGGQLRQDAATSFAAYLVHSVKAFEANGVPVRYLSLQNEPLYETKDYPGTLMPAGQEAQLIGSFVGPALEKAGLNTQILAYDHNWDHPEYATAVLSDQSAERYLAGSAFHCYAGNPSAQERVHESFPDKGLWMTECSGGTWQKGNLLAVTEDLLIESVRHWAKAVVLWGLALDEKNGPHSGGCATCRGFVTVDRSAAPHKITYTPDYYAIGQASRYVHPGAVRIGSTEVTSSIETAAFLNSDSSIALLVLNSADKAAKISVSWQGKNFSTSLDAGSVATYIWQAHESGK